VHLIQGSKLTLLGAALLVLALGGCGRKSGLDAPPQAAAQPAGQPGQPPRSNPLGLLEVEQDEGPVAPAGQKRRLIIDRILD
jgi:predicted small lipoprotein YifL